MMIDQQGTHESPKELSSVVNKLEILPPSLKAAISRVVLSQTFTTLTKFIEKNAKIYSTKLIPLK